MCVVANLLDLNCFSPKFCCPFLNLCLKRKEEFVWTLISLFFCVVQRLHTFYSLTWRQSRRSKTRFCSIVAAEKTTTLKQVFCGSLTERWKVNTADSARFNCHFYFLALRKLELFKVKKGIVVARAGRKCSVNVFFILRSKEARTRAATSVIWLAVALSVLIFPSLTCQSSLFLATRPLFSFPFFYVLPWIYFSPHPPLLPLNIYSLVFLICSIFCHF